jgi:co-chaperonin GroES (HSP10)
MSKNFKIIPRKMQVLVRPDDEPSRESEHGIYKPDNEDVETKAIGTVEAVGPGVEDLKVGDKVIYGAFAGEKIKFKDSDKDADFILLLDEEVLAFVVEEK